MAVSATSSRRGGVPHPGLGTDAAGPGGAGRGVITGKYFNAKPLPPAADILGNPLVVRSLSVHRLPRETIGNRVGRFLARLNIGSQSAETRLRWTLHDTIHATLASLSPSAAHLAGARVAAGKRSAPIIVVRHPYHLRHAFEMLPQLPGTLAAERRFLELVLSRALRRYGEQMSLMKGSPFSFEHEAKEYFYSGFRLEKKIKKIGDSGERFPVLRAVHTNYSHGRSYYLYSLIRRERLAPDNKLFMLFARAAYFMARIDWNGELLGKPNPRMLPSRDDLLFFV
ncbi:hypothetical protein [Azospirillum picis]|uniref:Uncharacterized protein n=1 Tax=Azospirillum picis TaxID=488438 RepID=A0ABU0MG65_9PROT|nr:hypothetical protein [Azospirillum picis]MBP2298514.1 hypothetical protein [Azospirillum picis]MDQ0532437.1 hypothetical protein [Azospirillum picis]